MKDFAQIFKKALEKRSDYISENNLEAFRLYDRENDKLTEVAVDVYQDWCLVQIFSKIPENKLSAVIDALFNEIKFKGVYAKNRGKQNSGRTESRLLIGTKHPENFFITENGLKFIIDLESYLDTGLFLDARIIRQKIQRLTRKKRVLNLFSYTAASSIYAAAGGARETVNVDISKTYSNQAKKNFDLNQFSLNNNKIIIDDVMKFINSEKGRAEKYDLIIVDPPTFSHSKTRDFSIQKDHVRLLNDCLYAVNKNGRIIFSTHYQRFKMAKPVILGKIKEITNLTIPPDFSKMVHRSFIISHSGKWGRRQNKV